MLLFLVWSLFSTSIISYIMLIRLINRCRNLSMGRLLLKIILKPICLHDIGNFSIVGDFLCSKDFLNKVFTFCPLFIYQILGRWINTVHVTIIKTWLRLFVINKYRLIQHFVGFISYQYKLFLHQDSKTLQ